MIWKGEFGALDPVALFLCGLFNFSAKGDEGMDKHKASQVSN